MNDELLFAAIRLRGDKTIKATLANIDLLKRTINLYKTELKQSENDFDLNRAATIKFKVLPEIEQTLIEAKKVLLRTIAESAFEVINEI